MKTVEKYMIKVDMRSNEHIAMGDLKIYRPVVESDTYAAKPFHGTVCAVPNGGKVPLGATVYMHYHAIDSHTVVDGADYYFPLPHEIVAWSSDDGEKHAHKCLLIEVIPHEKLKSSLIEVVDYSQPKTSRARIISSGIDGWNSGDIIEYRPGVDWEYLMDQTPHYFISESSVKHIVRRNEELAPLWLTVEKKVEEKFGFDVSKNWWIVLEGEYKGSLAFSKRKPILDKYIPMESVEAILPQSSQE